MYFLWIWGVVSLCLVERAGAETLHSAVEMRAAWDYSRVSNDQGDAVAATQSQSLSMQEAQWLIRSSRQNVSFASRITFAGDQPEVLSGSLGWRTKLASLKIGLLPLPVGGFAAQRVGASDLMRPRYLELVPFTPWQPAAEAGWHGFGDWRLVVWDDVVRDDNSPHRWNEDSHPTVGTSALFSWDGLEALLQTGLYDNTKSHWVDLGVRSLRGTLQAELSGHYRNETTRFPDAGFIRELGNVTLGMTARVSLLDQQKKYYFEWSRFDVVQANERHLSADRKHNRYARSQLGEVGEPLWDDHGGQALLGVSHFWDPGFEGFATVKGEQGSWESQTAGDLQTIRFVTVSLGVILRTAPKTLGG